MFEIVSIPAFNDNYIWLIRDDKNAIVVDPGDAKPVIAYLQANKLNLLAVLITHRHNDHIGGIPKLREVYNTRVYGPRSELIPLITHHLGEGDHLDIEELGLHFDILSVPGHVPELPEAGRRRDHRMRPDPPIDDCALFHASTRGVVGGGDGMTCILTGILIGVGSVAGIAVVVVAVIAILRQFVSWVRETQFIDDPGEGGD